MSTVLKATISERILTKANRLFSNTLEQVLAELLQNARRAGATLVTITTQSAIESFKPIIDFAPPEAGLLLITVTDNGTGIEDFSKLLHLGDSNWNEDVEVREDPAGMGIFSLIHTGALITSRGKSVNLTQEVFLGKVEVPIVDAEFQPGTTIQFVRSESLDRIKGALKEVATYGPIDVSFNGSLVEREDFLADAEFIKEFPGYRVGVQRGSRCLRNAWGGLFDRKSKANFHGLVIGEVNLGAEDLNFKTRVDVLDASILHLELPARNAVVQDAAYTALQASVRRAVFEFLASLPEHFEPFKVWKESKELGIDLKESSPCLKSFVVYGPTEGSEPISKTLDVEKAGYELGEKLAKRFAVVELPPDTESILAVSFDLEWHERGLPGDLIAVEANSAYAGYQWYDNLPRITDVSLFIDGNKAPVKAEKDISIVDDLRLSFAIQLIGRLEERVEWSLQFAGEQNYDDSEIYVNLFLARTSPWVVQETPYAKDAPINPGDFVQHVGFWYSDDGDSWSTQQEEFTERVETALVKVLGGKLSAAKLHLDRALTWPLTTAFNNANVTEVRLYRDDGGNWQYELKAA